MKEAELRIGNWFYSTAKGRNEQFEKHHFCSHNDSSVESYYIEECAEPIPLTEEWLERFGIMQNTWFEDGSYMIKEDRGFGWEMYVRNAVKTKRISFAYFKHVHQLQNLYFALTGKELTQNK